MHLPVPRALPRTCAGHTALFPIRPQVSYAAVSGELPKSMGMTTVTKEYAEEVHRKKNVSEEEKLFNSVMGEARRRAEAQAGGDVSVRVCLRVSACVG